VARRWEGRDLAKGTRARILGGPHTDRIVIVFDTWDSRGELRVDLGPEAKRAVADVGMTYQVERVT